MAQSNFLSEDAQRQKALAYFLWGPPYPQDGFQIGTLEGFGHLRCASRSLLDPEYVSVRHVPDFSRDYNLLMLVWEKVRTWPLALTWDEIPEGGWRTAKLELDEHRMLLKGSFRNGEEWEPMVYVYHYHSPTAPKPSDALFLALSDFAQDFLERQPRSHEPGTAEQAPA